MRDRPIQEDQMIKKKAGYLVLSLLLLAVACGSGATDTAGMATATPAISRPGANAPQPWEQEWDRVKAEARKEGKVVMAGSMGPEQISVLRKVMGEKFGIDAEFLTGRSMEITPKIIAEQNAGLYQVDLFFSGGQQMMFVFKPEGRIDRIDTALILPEVKDPQKWFGGRFPWADKEERYHVTFFANAKSGTLVNAQMVKPGDLKSVRDFLDPKWKEKIVINDPTMTGAGNSWFTPLAVEVGLDYFRELLKQDPIVLRDQRLMVEWIAKGKYPILLGYDEIASAEFVNAGAPIGVLDLPEGGYITQGSGAISLLTKAPHPNAARVAINWVLSQEGGAMLSKAMDSQSARVDVPSDFLPPARLRQPGKKYADAIPEDYQGLKLKYLDVAKEIFGPYMKK